MVRFLSIYGLSPPRRAGSPAVATLDRQPEQQRLAALDTYYDHQFALGLHREVTGELAELAAEHPLRETTVAQLMLALYRGEATVAPRQPPATSTGTGYDAVSQGGTNAGPFELQYSGGYGGWAFTSASADASRIWMWPGDLAYYVATYHVELPREFIDNMRANSWIPPTLTQAQLIDLERSLFER